MIMRVVVPVVVVFLAGLFFLNLFPYTDKHAEKNKNTFLFDPNTIEGASIESSSPNVTTTLGFAQQNRLLSILNNAHPIKTLKSPSQPTSSTPSPRICTLYRFNLSQVSITEREQAESCTVVSVQQNGNESFLVEQTPGELKKLFFDIVN